MKKLEFELTSKSTANLLASHGISFTEHLYAIIVLRALLVLSH